MKKILLIALLLWCSTLARAQNIVKMEYWIDTDPGFDAAIPITGYTAQTNVALFPFTLPASVSVGFHVIGFRTKDANNVWSLTNLNSLYVFAMPVATNIMAMEYWIDTDPGFGLATPITGFTQQPDLAGYLFPIVIPSNLSQGIHTMGYRSKNANNQWSITNFKPVYVADGSTGLITTVEYFWDTDPGFGNGRISTTPFTPIADLVSTILPDSVDLILSQGNHNLFSRSRDNRGRWSHTNMVTSVSVIGTVDVKELNKLSGINVYPNPFVESITITPSDNKTSRVILYDANGKKIMDKNITQETKLDMQQFAKGSYSLFVQSSDTIIYKTKILKQ